MVRIRNRWPVHVVVLEKRGTSEYSYEDRARRELDKDKHFIYKLKKAKKVTRPVEYDYIFAGNLLHVYSPSPEDYIPVTFDAQSGKYKVLDIDTRQWALMRFRSMWERYNPKSGWEKWAWLFVILIVCVSIGLLLWFFFNGFTNGMKEFGNAIEKLVPPLNSIADKIALACKAGPTTPVPPA